MDIPAHQSVESAVAGLSEHKRLRLRSARTLYPLRQHTSRVHQGHRAGRALTAFVLPVHSLGAGDAPYANIDRYTFLFGCQNDANTDPSFLFDVQIISENDKKSKQFDGLL